MRTVYLPNNNNNTHSITCESMSMHKVHYSLTQPYLLAEHYVYECMHNNLSLCLWQYACVCVCVVYPMLGCIVRCVAAIQCVLSNTSNAISLYWWLSSIYSHFGVFFSSSRLYLYRNHKQRFIVHVECFYLRRVPDCVDSKIELQPIQNRFTLSLIGITFNENVDITQSKSSMYDRTIRSVWHPISSCFCIHCTLFPLPLLWYFCCIFAAAALSCCCRSMHTIRVSAVLFGLVKHTDVNIACLLI